jgi:hypothetical protein
MTPGYYLPRQRVSVLYPENGRDYVGLDTLAGAAAAATATISSGLIMAATTTLNGRNGSIPIGNGGLSTPSLVGSGHNHLLVSGGGNAMTTTTTTTTGRVGSATITLGTINNIDEDLTKNPIARTLAKERRTCKSFNGEVVWPPKVEAALVQGA